jgi:CubicO group peptidase (beta-lactamase class C family)
MLHRLSRTAPEAQGISSTAILKFIDTAERTIHELHSFMLVRHGQVVAEGWWNPYVADRSHMLYSLSKSFTSSAIGLAVAEGRLSVEDKVVSFFPEDVPTSISPTLAAMRVHDLLAMATGHDQDVTDKLRSADTWVKGFFAQPVEHEPGTHFVYNSAATFMLSAIIQKLTGMKLIEYLKLRLLDPLGIDGATWEENPQGINVGGWGLNIRTEDIACFGQMYLQKGMWNGKRILSEEWIAAATTQQVDNSSNTNVDWKQGYGYQFWRCQHNGYRGDGAFGQYCIVMPEQDAVIAITSGVGDMQGVLTLIWDQLLPAMKASPLPADASAHTQLTQKLNALAFQPPQGMASSPIASIVSGKSFQIDKNDWGLEEITFNFSDKSAEITMDFGGGTHPVTAGYGVWQPGEMQLFFSSPRLVASGVWTAENTYSLTLRFYETPYYFTFACHFVEDRIDIDGAMNVSFGPTTIALVGRLEKQQA